MHSHRASMHNHCAGVHSHHAGMHNHRAGVHSHHAGVHSHHAGVHNHRAGVHNHRADVHNHRAGVHNHRADVHNHRADVHNHRADVHSHRADVHNHRADVHNYRADSKYVKNLLNSTHSFILNGIHVTNGLNNEIINVFLLTSHKCHFLSCEKRSIFLKNRLKLMFLNNFLLKNYRNSSHKRQKMSLETFFLYVIFVIERF